MTKEENKKISIFNATDERTQNLIGLKIREARKDNNLSLKELCDLLKKYGVDISISTLSLWELGYTTCNPYQLIALCCCLNIRDPMLFFLGKDGLDSIGYYTNV